VEQFPEHLRQLLDVEWTRNTDAISRVQILLPLLRHATKVAGITEDHLAHGTRHELSEGLADEVSAELEELGLGGFKVVIAHGPADNFTTTYGDLAQALFRPLAAPTLPPAPPQAMFALFKIPRIEGSGIWWRPILIGHEVAHVAVTAFDSVAQFDLPTRFDFEAAKSLDNPEGAGPTASIGLFRIASNWATELLCDVHALCRFGPSAVASLAEYLTTIGATDSISTTHPPGALRIRLLLDQLGTVHSARFRSIIEGWSDLTPTTVNLATPWAQHLAEMFLQHRDALMAAVGGFPTATYDHTQRSPIVQAVADELCNGVPGRQTVALADGSVEKPTAADVVNAAWISRTEDASTPIDTLARKAIESLDFIDRWLAAGGVIPEAPPLGDDEAEAKDPVVLSENAIERRLQSPSENSLVVTPLLHRPKGAALDLRLGNRFIVFRRSSITSFDPLDITHDPRSVQVYAELGWHEKFVLHPQEMVLGATLEYLVLPDDLTAQVITRSSYGRLGLLSATAVQVHPRFRGCLTLELVNLSTIPLTLTPGERIAQLVLWSTDPVAATDEKYSCPTGPQFSKVQDDAEARTLRAIADPT
jgi:deoxycytidine triphosphate deaminase